MVARSIMGEIVSARDFARATSRTAHNGIINRGWTVTERRVPMGLEGPSRTITVEPVRKTQPVPEPERDPVREAPAERPDREPVPAP